MPQGEYGSWRNRAWYDGGTAAVGERPIGRGDCGGVELGGAIVRSGFIVSAYDGGGKCMVLLGHCPDTAWLGETGVAGPAELFTLRSSAP